MLWVVRPTIQQRENLECGVEKKFEWNGRKIVIKIHKKIVSAQARESSSM
jgi:hypothetical protein